MPHSSPLSVWFHPLQRQPFFLVQPIHHILPNSPAFAVQQYADLPISVPYSCLSDLADTHPQLSAWIAVAPIAVGASGHAQNPARSPLAHPIAANQMLHHRSTPRRLHHFFESTSCNIVLSSVRSATRCSLGVLSLLKPRTYVSAGLDAGGDWAIEFRCPKESSSTQ
jgi:hypothetical protein